MSTGVKPIFAILWIEDNPESIETEKIIVEKYIEEKGYEPKVKVITKVTEITAEVHQGLYDIVVTDKNIAEGLTGEQIVETLRIDSLMTEVIYYSAVASFDPDTERKNLSKYGGVIVLKGKRDISVKITKQIDENLRKWEDIAILRGTVIDKTIELEGKLNLFLAAYFQVPETKKDNFIESIMENHFSLEGKIQALERIIDRESKKNFKDVPCDIREIQKARDAMAHCKVNPRNRDELVSVKRNKPFLRKDKVREILASVTQIAKRLDELSSELSS